LCSVRPAGDYGIIGSPPEAVLQKVGLARFISTPPGMSQPINFNFLEANAKGQMTYLYSGARVLTRSDV